MFKTLKGKKKLQLPKLFVRQKMTGNFENSTSTTMDIVTLQQVKQGTLSTVQTDLEEVICNGFGTLEFKWY